MPELTIDGQQVQVAEGTNLILAARKLGIDIPHFCYHPGLTVVGSCRMCQVEIEVGGRKRIDLGCANAAAEGMIVRVNAPEAVKARQAVLEFLLMNHPLDCPICDDAGECKLQDYYMIHGLYNCRLDVPKWHKPKVHTLGPTVVLDAERCVLCSRCVRFCDEIWGERQLGIFGHGSNELLINYPGRELDNPYTENVVDLCPVGALLSKDFQYRRRVWYLKSVKSVCPMCSRGCNIYLHFDVDHVYAEPGTRIFRVKPRYNPAVNRWWISDRGRFGYKFIDDPKRAKAPQVRGREVLWDEAIAQAADLLRQSQPEAVAVLIAPSASNEDAFAALRLIRETLKLKHLAFEIPHADKLKSDHVLLTDDPYPNRRGFADLGFASGNGSLRAAGLLSAIHSGKIKGLMVADSNLSTLGAEINGVLRKLDWLIVVSHSQNELWDQATVALPMAVYAERPGTFTNFKGLVQKFEKAVEPLGVALPQWQIWQKLAQKLGAAWNYENERQIFRELAAGKPEYETLNWNATAGVRPACYNDNWYMW